LSHVRMIAFDGGPAAWLEYLILEHLVQEEPGTIAEATHFVGTSAGSYLALWLAARPEGADPAQWLRRFRPHLNSIYAAFGGGARAWARLLSGRAAMNGMARIAAVLRQIFEVEAGVKTLADLHYPVTLCSYALDLEGTDGKDLGQAPDFIGAARYPDLSVVDAALRSSAFPLVVPIYQGHVDGAVFANNPALVGVVDALSSPGNRRDGVLHLTDFRVLSLGGADRLFGSAAIRKKLHRNREDNWGTAAWLFRLFNPLLLLDLLYNAQPRAAAATLIQMLGEDRFQRVAPSQPENLSMEFVDVLLNLDKVLYVNAMVTFEAWSAAPAGQIGGGPQTLQWVRDHWVPALDAPGTGPGQGED